MSAEPCSHPERRTITNARVVTPERVIADGYVVVDGDRIEDVGAGDVRPTGATIDAAGRLVLPGLVDLHGDELERHLFPRPGARVPTPTALVSSDRGNVAAGITTKFHAVAFEEAPDADRSLALAEEVVDAVSAADGLLADTRIHARCELGEDRAVRAVSRVIDQHAIDLVSLMNHLPDQGQFEGTDQFCRRYPDGGRVMEEREPVPPSNLSAAGRRIVRTARAAGVPVAAHDVEHERQVEAHADRGVSICEYPVTLDAARTATRRGMVTAMGAPNLVRGGSLWGNLSVSDAIRSGAVDVLCTDFHPPSLLSSVFVGTGEPLARRVARVSKAPADAVGLSDRGRIEPGARADLLVVDRSAPPRVERVIVSGTDVFRAPG